MFGLKHVNSQIFAYLCVFFLLLNINAILGATMADSWLIFAKETKKVLNRCYRNHTDLAISWKCFKYHTIILFEDIAAADTIPLTSTLELIRNPNAYDAQNVSNNQILDRKYEVKIPEDFSWTNEIARRMVKAISSHGLRYIVQSDVNEPRRRHRMRMFPAMIFGMAVLGVVIIPIGFHIMTIIGGTALLFGKMALLLAVINGSKRLVPQGVHYGSFQDHYYGHWDRNHEPHDHHPPPSRY